MLLQHKVQRGNEGCNIVIPGSNVAIEVS
jgi:hypothetical protein